MRLHMCKVYVCTAQDMVLCVGQSVLFVCPIVLFCGWGAAEVSHSEGHSTSQP